MTLWTLRKINFDTDLDSRALFVGDLLKIFCLNCFAYNSSFFSTPKNCLNFAFRNTFLLQVFLTTIFCAPLITSNCTKNPLHIGNSNRYTNELLIEMYYVGNYADSLHFFSYFTTQIKQKIIHVKYRRKAKDLNHRQLDAECRVSNEIY